MIITVSELRQFVSTERSDAALSMMIESAESFVRHFTKNDFINRETHETEYPKDVKMGVVNLIRWDISFRDKVGISSETISRHSVSYSGGGDSAGGYPNSLVSFLHPYMKARF